MTFFLDKLIIYIYLSFQFLKAAEYALNVIFRTPPRRAVHHTFLVSIVIMSIIIQLFLASFGIATVFSSAPLLRPYLPKFGLSVLSRFLLGFVIPFSLVWFVMMLLYLFLPTRKPPFLASAQIAFVVSLVFEAAKHLFTWYAGSITGLGHLYGSLTVFIIFLLWVYYSSCLFLLGADRQGRNQAAG